MWRVLSASFHRQRNRSLEKLDNFLIVTYLGSGRGRIWFLIFMTQILAVSTLQDFLSSYHKSIISLFLYWMCISNNFKIIYLGRTVTQNMKMQIVVKFYFTLSRTRCCSWSLGIPPSAARASCHSALTPSLCWPHGLISSFPLRVCHVNNITL